MLQIQRIMTRHEIMFICAATAVFMKGFVIYVWSGVVGSFLGLGL
jgi:hypothetical protein